MNLRGFANRLRALRPGDSFVVECEDARPMQLRLASNIACFKRAPLNGWTRFQTLIVPGGVRVTRLPDAIPSQK